MTRTTHRFARLLACAILFLAADAARAQMPEEDWDAVFQRRQGWLGADGIYSVDLRFDAASNDLDQTLPHRVLFLFSDTLSGKTKNDGRDYDGVRMTNHSFALLEGNAPDPEKIKFLWSKPDADAKEKNPQNILPGHYWLQDAVRWNDRVWGTAILVGDAWKPARVDALEIPIDPKTLEPDFENARIRDDAPLSFKTRDAQIVLGCAICDDADDDFLYVFGYVDRFREFSRKDAVVARAPRKSLTDFKEWRFYLGEGIWSDRIEDLVEPSAALARNVSCEYSVSRAKINGKDKWMLVYTPGVISNRVAYRIAPSPIGPFDEERVFYQSPVPEQIPGVKCYNAKAHPALSNDKNRLLVSYNVNRLGEIAKAPAEYRPRFVWLDLDRMTKEEKMFGRRRMH